MAAIVMFLRPSGEPIFVNADHVVAVMAAPNNRAALHFTSDRFQSIEVDVTPDAAAEALTSAASGFAVYNVASGPLDGAIGE